MSLNPAVITVLERLHGVEWYYQQFDYARSMGVCGMTRDRRRWAARFSTTDRRTLPDGTKPHLFPCDWIIAYADKVEQAKTLVRAKLFSTERCIEGDEWMEGNEIQI